ncbi:hypothetical protein GGF43_005164, partial [Coemansia sp. RSA 2618]
MFSRNTVFRQPATSRAKAASISDPLTSTSQVLGAINQISPASDDSAKHGQRVVSGRHEVLKELKPSLAARSPSEAAASTKSFPSTGLSRSRKASAVAVQTSAEEITRVRPKSVEDTISTKDNSTNDTTPRQTNSTEEATRLDNSASQDNSAAALADGPQTIGVEETMAQLPHDSLGRRMWLHFQAAAEQGDLRDMVADSPTGVLVLPVSAHAGEPDFDALLNDNVLFTEHALDNDNGSERDAKCKFTTVSGICGVIDQGSVCALGVLPPMEELMQAVGETDLPRTTLFDVMDANVASPPLQRLRVARRVGCWRLPDARRVQVVVTSGPLERRLVVDSAVTTLSARIYDAVDATFGALLPQAPEPLTASDQIKVDIEEIMRYAHAVELRAHTSRSSKDASAGRKALAWIAGQKSARAGSPRTAAASIGPGAFSANIDVDGETWQHCMAQFQDHAMDYLAHLEDETSMCGDMESRRKICSGLLECVEKLAMESLYSRVFSPSFSDDRAQDEQVASKIAALNMAGITLEHLGLAEPLSANPELLRICAEAGRLLDRVDSMRSPAEKLKLI